MIRALPTSGLAALLFGLGTVAGAQDASVAPPTPPQWLTTDTQSYCHQLALRLDQLTTADANVPASVRDLESAGRQMCDRGQTRAGILRLRSAIVLMMNPDNAENAESPPSR